MLISNEALSALQKEVIEAEGKLVDFISDVDKEYELAIDFIDEEKMLLSIKEELVKRRDNVKKYLGRIPNIFLRFFIYFCYKETFV